jgi:hypothetical protein
MPPDLCLAQHARFALAAAHAEARCGDAQEGGRHVEAAAHDRLVGICAAAASVEGFGHARSCGSRLAAPR